MASKTEQQLNKALETLHKGNKLTASDRKVLKVAAEAMIDAFMRGVKLDPEELTDENGWRHLHLDSASGFACVNEADGELYLHAEALVMELPSDGDVLQALMREALQLNLNVAGTCRLGIRGKALICAATEDLRLVGSTDDFARLIHTVMGLANAIDDEYQKKFSRSTRTRKRVGGAAV